MVTPIESFAAAQVADVALANATTQEAAFDITATALQWIIDAPTQWIWDFVLSEFERVPWQPGGAR